MSVGTAHVLRLAGRGSVLTIDKFDDAWITMAGAGEDVTAVDIDLRSVTYLAHETLLFLVGVLSEQSRRDQPTAIELPNDSRVLDYLRAWSFPAAVEQATGRAFESFLSTDSLGRYRNVSDSPPRYLAVLATPSGGREQLLPRSSFALTPVSLADNPTQAATVATSPWLDRHIISVLDRYLGGFGKRIGTQLIREAVLNAANHPMAKVAFTSAQVIRRRSSDGTSHSELEIAIWDDGKTFVETLSRALRSEHTVRSPAFGFVEEKFHIVVSDRGVQSKIIKLTSTDHSTVANPEHLMVSSFMLGVTSAPRTRSDSGERGETYAELAEDVLPAEARVHGGLGLYLIRKTVIDQFGGEIRYVSGRHRLLMRLDEAPNHYRGTIHRLGPHACPFRGNLLIASFPLRRP